MDTRRLKSFVKIVDAGSVTRAADLLHIAQPALSQQIATLESQFKQKLLIRSQQGVKPTRAGQTLYRHAQVILKQLEQAHIDIQHASGLLAGSVSVGLAPYSAAATLSLSLLTAVRERFPRVLLSVQESFGGAYSEQIMNGRLDMAVLHGAGPMHGLAFQPLFVEEFFLVAPLEVAAEDGPPRAVAELRDLPLLLPTRSNFVRKAVDTAFARAGQVPMVVAEIESLSTLRSAVAQGLGCTIMPWSVARELVTSGVTAMTRIINPAIQETVSICIAEHMPLSEAASAVQTMVLELAHHSKAEGQWNDVMGYHQSEPAS